MLIFLKGVRFAFKRIHLSLFCPLWDYWLIWDLAFLGSLIWTLTLFDGYEEGNTKDGKVEHLGTPCGSVHTYPSSWINENSRWQAVLYKTISVQPLRTVPGGHQSWVWSYHQLSTPILHPLLTGRQEICITNCLNIQFLSTSKALFVFSSSNG